MVGIIEKHKRFSDNIYVPDDWTRVIKTARKHKPFQVMQLTKQEFIKPETLEKSITSRKKTSADGAINWLKIKWLRYTKEDTYHIFFRDQ